MRREDRRAIFALMRSPGRGMLLVNLGSPDSPSVHDVRRYLRQFLMDGRVIDLPWPVRALIVEGLILPFRPKRSAAAYRLIWTDQGSPLVVISRRVRDKLAARLGIPVALGMRYGNPSITLALKSLVEADSARDILLIPMFPHYAMSTYESAVVQVKRQLRRIDPALTLTVHPPYFDDPLYIDALVASAVDHLSGDHDHLLFSYHGVPERHLRKTDPTTGYCLVRSDCCQTVSDAHATCYRAQVYHTTERFVRKAGIPAGKYSVAFQSRLGRERWLLPSTDSEIFRLAQTGVRRLLVICPSFVADCLETIEEIGEEGKDIFLSAGGTEFRLIPCLNDRTVWIDALTQWTKRWLGGGP